MKKISVFLLMIFSMNGFASIARLSAFNQGKDGSLFLMDERNVFINPSNLGEQKLFTLESEGEALWLGDGYGLSFGREVDAKPVLEGFLSLTDMLAISSYLNISNGQGVSVWGMNLGLHVDTLGIAVGVNVAKDELEKDHEVLPFTTLQYSFSDMTAYFQYEKLLEKYDLTAGLGMIKKESYFVDGEYERFMSVDMLSLSLGANYDFMKDVSLLGSVKQYVFFDYMTSLGLGACWAPSEQVSIEGAIDIAAIGKPNPVYGDFNAKLSATFYY